MKIYDCHVHLMKEEVSPANLISKLEAGGAYGACVFSIAPFLDNPDKDNSYDYRLNSVLNMAKEYPGRLLPVLRIHPYEEDILSKVEYAAEKGVVGFKIICNNFYVYEDKSLRLLEKIASLDKPVFFHTGILWGSESKPTSIYNRPLYWEYLLPIEGLRFSMGHCSWPWHDECLALYGKFAWASRSANTAKMYLDLTGGTPKIYREELFNKLFNIGYNTKDYTMFGTDYFVRNDNKWNSYWVDVDNEIYDKMGIDEETRNKIYNENLFKFLGIKQPE